MNDNFEKFKFQLNKKPNDIPLQQVQPLTEKSEIKEKEHKRYPGTRQLNVDLDEELFLMLKTRAVLERTTVRKLTEEAIILLLKSHDQ